MHESLVEQDSNTTNQKCKGDESPSGSSASSKEALSIGLFEHSNMSSQSIDHHLCMEAKEENVEFEVKYDEIWEIPT